MTRRGEGTRCPSDAETWRTDKTTAESEQIQRQRKERDQPSEKTMSLLSGRRKINGVKSRKEERKKKKKDLLKEESHTLNKQRGNASHITLLDTSRLG